jgi:hypothetical protein
MKVAKLLLAAAIAAPSLFLTSCEKQIDTQATTIDRSATTSLAKPVAVGYSWFENVAEDGTYTLSATPNVSCGTGNIQRLDGTKWVDVTTPVSIAAEMFVTLALPAKPATGTQYRVFFVPEKGKNGCPDNLQRGGSAPFTVQ